MIPVSDKKCSNSPRPISVEVCNGNVDCVTIEPYWITGEWNEVQKIEFNFQTF